MIREHIPSIRNVGIDGYWTPRRRLPTNKEVADEKKNAIWVGALANHYAPLVSRE